MSLSRISLAAALVFVGLIGSSEAGQLILAVRAIAATIGGALIVAYLIRAPRRHDQLDIAVLAALLAFLLTCITSSIPRLSFDAATTAVAYTAAFYLAREATADLKGRQLATTVLGLMGCLVAIGYVIPWSASWLRWAAVPDAGFPPVGLALPPAPFGHHYLVGTLAAVLLPGCVALARRPLVWPIGVAGTIAGSAIVVMSGSRTVWLAIVVGALVAVALGARVRWPTWRWVLPAAAVLIAGIALLGRDLLQRLATTSTVEGRLEIYWASLERWLDAPLLGHGPGTYSAQMTLAGHDELLTHGHNAMVQVLVEGGIVGLAGLLLVVAAVTTIATRSRPPHATAIAGLTVFAVAAMTDNPTVFGFLVVPSIAWAAVACPREPGTMLKPASWTERLTLSLAAAGALAAAATLGASWAYERAAIPADADDTKAVIAALQTAVTLDPGHPLYQRDLGIWLLADGQIDAARARLDRAIDANPADPAAQRAAAIAAATAGDGAGIAIAKSVVELRRGDPANLMTLAFVARQLGDSPSSTDALVQALRYEPWLPASEPWQEHFGQQAGALLRAARAELDGGEPAGAAAWLGAVVGEAPDPATLSDTDAAMAATIDCRPEEALELLGPLAESALDAEWLLARVLAGRAEDQPVDDYLTLAELRWPILVFLASNDVTGASPFSALSHEVQFYGRRAIPPPNEGPVLPSSESGLSAWLRDPVAAADRGAPDSGLAACR